MATLSAFSRTVARPAAARAVAGVRRVVSGPAQPLAAPAKLVQRGTSTSAAALFGLGGSGAAIKEKTDTVYDFTVTGIDGNKIPLSKFKGKVLVIVNVTSACGFTPQYAGFQDLVSTYGKKGLEVLFFPCNQFGGQEPGSNADVKSFAQKQGFKGVLMAKVDVNGTSAELLFQFMKQKQGGLLTSDIKWNFSKFLVDREGNVVGRYASTATPESLKKEIEKFL